MEILIWIIFLPRNATGDNWLFLNDASEEKKLGNKQGNLLVNFLHDDDRIHVANTTQQTIMDLGE